MYLHLGGEEILNTREIVGIFDLDTTTISKWTREALAMAEKAGQVVTVTTELPKSFVVAAAPVRSLKAARRAGGCPQRIYVGQLSAPTLKKRHDVQVREKKYIKW